MISVKNKEQLKKPFPDLYIFTPRCHEYKKQLWTHCWALDQGSWLTSLNPPPPTPTPQFETSDESPFYVFNMSLYHVCTLMGCIMSMQGGNSKIDHLSNGNPCHNTSTEAISMKSGHLFVLLIRFMHFLHNTLI